MRAVSVLFLLASIFATVCGFQVAPPPPSCSIRKSAARSHKPLVIPLKMSTDPDKEEQNVRVDLVEDVDSFSLTAIGFGLIAFNFLVLANLGDAGIGGVVARFINFWNS